MCHFGEGGIERCQHCSETEFLTLIKVALNVAPPRPAYQIVAPMVPHHSNLGHPLSTKYNYHIDTYGNLMARNIFDHEQASNQHTQPSRHDAAISEMMPRKQQRVHTDQAPFMRNVQGAARTAQQIHSNQLAAPMCDGRAHNQSHQHLPPSSRQNTTTYLKGECEKKSSDQAADQTHPRKEDLEAWTPRMNKLPTACWKDERIFIPLVQAKLANEAYFRHQEQRLNDIWRMYGKERKALAAYQAPPLEETWTPVFEEEEIVECETDPWEEVWGRSVLEGEASMRDILDEDETWPQEAPEKPDVWTREPDGMFSSNALKKLLRVSLLENTLHEKRFG